MPRGKKAPSQQMVLADQRRKRVFEQWLEGKTHKELADMEGVGTSTISRDLDGWRKKLAQENLATIEEKRAVQLHKLQYLFNTARKSFELS